MKIMLEMEYSGTWKNCLLSFVRLHDLLLKSEMKVILSPIFRDRMKWSCDGSLANQMSWFLFMFTNKFAYKIRHLVLFTMKICEWISLIITGKKSVSLRILLGLSPHSGVNRNIGCCPIGIERHAIKSESATTYQMSTLKCPHTVKIVLSCEEIHNAFIQIYQYA
jgi:hypothetical protein